MNGPDDEEDEPGRFASPPCFMHEVDASYAGIEAEDGASTDVAQWRKAQRAQLIERRFAIPQPLRRRYDAGIVEYLADAIREAEGLTLGLYWPFRGEPDLRPLLRHLNARGACCALPVVTHRRGPLEFRAWAPGDPLVRGVWNIPVPGEDAPVVVPKIIVAPLVGYDDAGFRLGYGGGYYDRTLAALPDRQHVFGVGYSISSIPTIYPQWHDVPMDALVTEEGPVSPARGSSK